MHILVIASWYPCSELPLNGIFFQEQAELLAKAGHQVSVLGVNMVSGKSLAGKVTDRLCSLKTRLRPGTSKWVDEYLLGRSFWSIERLKVFQTYRRLTLRNFFLEYAKRHGAPDVIHLQACLPGLPFAHDLADLFRIPWFVTEHSSAFLQKRITARQRAILTHYLPKADAVTAVSQALADRLAPFAPEKEVGVLPNVVDTAYYCPASQTGVREDDKEGRVFLAIGFLNANKNFEALIKAFSDAFSNKEEDVILNIGGCGDDECALRDLILHLGEEKRVHLLGKLGREDVRTQIRAANAIVSSSLVETFGITLIEAMSCGKPVLSTKSGGPESIVTKETGILIEQGDYRVLRNGLRRMYEEIQCYDAEVIRKYCVDHYSGDAYVHNIETICRTLISSITK